MDKGVKGTGVYKGWFWVSGTRPIAQMRAAGIKVIAIDEGSNMVEIEGTAEAIERFDAVRVTITQRCLRPPAPPCRRRLIRLRKCGASVPERRFRRRLVLIKEGDTI